MLSDKWDTLSQLFWAIAIIAAIFLVSQCEMRRNAEEEETKRHQMSVEAEERRDLYRRLQEAPE